MKIASIAFIIVSPLFIASCKEDTRQNEETPFKDFQVSRILILNTFSSTDSAIKTVAYFNDDITSISEDRGGGSSGDYSLKRFRAWSIHLKEGISQERRDKLVDFLKSLEDPYKTIESVDYGDCNTFEYKYNVNDELLRIDVRAEAEYTKY